MTLLVVRVGVSRNSLFPNISTRWLQDFSGSCTSVHLLCPFLLFSPLGFFPRSISGSFWSLLRLENYENFRSYQTLSIATQWLHTIFYTLHTIPSISYWKTLESSDWMRFFYEWVCWATADWEMEMARKHSFFDTIAETIYAQQLPKNSSE